MNPDEEKKELNENETIKSNVSVDKSNTSVDQKDKEYQNRYIDNRNKIVGKGLDKTIAEQMKEKINNMQGEEKKDYLKIIADTIGSADISNITAKNWDEVWHAIKEKHNDFALEDSNQYSKNFEKHVSKNLEENYFSTHSEEDIEKIEYYKNFISCILLEHNKEHSGTHIRIKGRFKSDESFLDKSLYRASKEEYDREITDMFAIKILVDASSESFSPNSEISKQRDENRRKISSLIDFSNSLRNPEKRNNMSKEEYYDNMIKLLGYLQDILPDEATDLRQHYLDEQNFIIQRKAYLPITQEKNMTEDEFHLSFMDYPKPTEYDNLSKTDFDYLFEDFSARIDDEHNFQLLQNQINTLFHSSNLGSDRLKKFDYKIISSRTKKKPNGYVSKFIILDTPAGKMEIQLQTANQEKEGEEGYAAHSDYKNNPSPEAAPDINDPKSIEHFRSVVCHTTPDYFDAYIDRNQYEPAALFVMKSSYLNLKTATQVRKGHPLEDVLQTYYEDIYKNRNKIFKQNNELQDSFQIKDIDSYIKSGAIEKLNARKNKKDSDELEL